MHRLAIAVLCLSAAGCVTIPADPASWPQGFPPRAYYQAIWEADGENQEIQSFEEYLTWVGRFYLGTPVSPGWQGIQEKLLADLEIDEVRLLAPRLSCLGQTVSCEWAKDNLTRRLNTPMLRTWVRFLSQAKGQGKAIQAVDRLLIDVAALVRGELEPETISLERYRDLIASGGE